MPQISTSAHLLEALRESLEPSQPLTEEERQRRQAETDQEFMLEPSVVTYCYTCERAEYMARLGCAYRDCPDYPMAVNVTHLYQNFQGQMLRPGRDWMPLEHRPLTEWT